MTTAEMLAAAEHAAASDPELQDVLDKLPEDWARDSSADGLKLFATLLRLAYGAGYTAEQRGIRQDARA